MAEGSAVDETPSDDTVAEVPAAADVEVEKE